MRDRDGVRDGRRMGGWREGQRGMAGGRGYHAWRWARYEKIGMAVAEAEAEE